MLQEQFQVVSNYDQSFFSLQILSSEIILTLLII